MAELLFFKPPFSSGSFTRSGSIYPPLGLCQLAACFSVGRYVIFDAEAEGLGNQATEDRIRLIKPKIVLMTASSFTLKIIECWAAWFKHNGILLVVGGPHPTLLPQETFDQCTSVDIAVRGEAESILPEIVDSLLSGASLPENSCCVREPWGQITKGNVHRIKDFSEVPFPVFNGLDITRYRCPDMKSGPMVTMMTSRGCNGRCTFCSVRSLHGDKLRGWSAAQVVAELKKLRSQGVREVSFFDDNFAMDKPRLLEICSGMIEQRIDLMWFCNARADMLDDKVVEAMSKAGCHQVYLGLESGAEVILNGIQKDLTLLQSQNGVNLLRKYGITVSAGFIIGLPGETNETVEETIGFASKLKLDRVQFSKFTPLPGSLLARKNTNTIPNDFHSVSDDQVGQWVQQAYASMPESELIG